VDRVIPILAPIVALGRLCLAQHISLPPVPAAVGGHRTARTSTTPVDDTPQRPEKAAWRHVPLADEPERDDPHREDPDYPALPAWEERL